jgi:tetratricopeptide (TPR) repeat protein
VKSVCLRNLGKDDDAIQAARYAIQRDADNPENYVILAEAYKEKRMIQEAAREVQAAIELNKGEQRKNPEDVRQIVSLQNKYDLAKEILNLVIELQLNEDAPQPQAFLQYINLLEDEANLKKLMVYYSAINLLETAVQQSTATPHPEIVMELVRVKAKVGQIDGAITILERVIESDPRNMRANRWLENLKAGRPMEDTSETAPSAMR